MVLPSLIVLFSLVSPLVAEAQYSTNSFLTQNDFSEAPYGSSFFVPYNDEEIILPWEFQFNSEYDAAYYAAFTQLVPFAPEDLEPVTPEELDDAGEDDRDTDNPGIVIIPPNCVEDVGVEGEHTDNPPEVFAPAGPGSYPVDFVYFPPNNEYPTGCIFDRFVRLRRSR